MPSCKGNPAQGSLIALPSLALSPVATGIMGEEMRLAPSPAQSVRAREIPLAPLQSNMASRESLNRSSSSSGSSSSSDSKGKGPDKTRVEAEDHHLMHR